MIILSYSNAIVLYIEYMKYNTNSYSMLLIVADQ